MNANIALFAAMNIRKEEVAGKRALEAGSLNVNGSLRPLIESYGPKEYVGTDISEGPGVDMICDVSGLEKKFGPESFDFVVSTEVIEHVRDWRGAVHNLKTVLKPGGALLISTRSAGFIYHGYPNDYWRYEESDMRSIFGDLRIEKIEKDPELGIFIKCVKPTDFVEKDLSGLELYSIVASRRAVNITENDLRSIWFRARLFKHMLKAWLHKAVDIL